MYDVKTITVSVKTAIKTIPFSTSVGLILYPIFLIYLVENDKMFDDVNAMLLRLVLPFT